MQTDLSLCSITYHNHATKGAKKKTWYKLYPESENTCLENGKKIGWFHFFSVEEPSTLNSVFFWQLFFTLLPSFTGCNTCGWLRVLNKSHLYCTFATHWHLNFWVFGFCQFFSIVVQIGNGKTKLKYTLFRTFINIFSSKKIKRFHHLQRSFLEVMHDRLRPKFVSLITVYSHGNFNYI